MSKEKPVTGEQLTEKSNSLSGKKIAVNAIDMTEDEVLEYDRKGATLVFDTTPGRFLKLSEKGVQALSQWNRDRYRVCLDVWSELVKDDPLADLVEGIEFGPNRGTAQERLHIDGRNKDFVYWWERPERVYAKQAAGWQVVQGTGEKTIHSRGERIHKIGKKGEEELVLMRLPKKLWQKYTREKAERYKKMLNGLSAAAMEGSGVAKGEIMEDSDVERLIASGKVRMEPIRESYDQGNTEGG